MIEERAYLTQGDIKPGQDVAGAGADDDSASLRLQQEQAASNTLLLSHLQLDASHPHHRSVDR